MCRLSGEDTCFNVVAKRCWETRRLIEIPNELLDPASCANFSIPPDAANNISSLFNWREGGPKLSNSGGKKERAVEFDDKSSLVWNWGDFASSSGLRDASSAKNDKNMCIMFVSQTKKFSSPDENKRMIRSPQGWWLPIPLNTAWTCSSWLCLTLSRRYLNGFVLRAEEVPQG